jgi:NDP-sugar pyrophosphorylase family protein
MGAKISNEVKKSIGYIVTDKNTNEVLHYTENSEIEVSNITNCGIYIFSVRMFSEYGMNPFPDD